jgi:hypothetical protein
MAGKSELASLSLPGRPLWARTAVRLAGSHGPGKSARVLDLLPRSRCPGSLDEGLDFLHRKHAVFVGIHRFEDPFVSRLKLLQGDGPITVAVHHGEQHPHHHAGMHAARTHHAASSAHHAEAYVPSVPVTVTSPTKSVVPARYLAVIVEVISSTTARHLGTLRCALPLLLGLCLLLHHRSLLRTRSGSATRQNESRRREHQDAFLHFNLLRPAPRPIQLLTSDIDPLAFVTGMTPNVPSKVLGDEFQDFLALAINLYCFLPPHPSLSTSSSMICLPLSLAYDADPFVETLQAALK